MTSAVSRAMDFRLRSRHLILKASLSRSYSMINRSTIVSIFPSIDLAFSYPISRSAMSDDRYLLPTKIGPTQLLLASQDFGFPELLPYRGQHPLWAVCVLFSSSVCLQRGMFCGNRLRRVALFLSLLRSTKFQFSPQYVRGLSSPICVAHRLGCWRVPPDMHLSPLRLS